MLSDSKANNISISYYKKLKQAKCRMGNKTSKLKPNCFPHMPSHLFPKISLLQGTGKRTKLLLSRNEEYNIFNREMQLLLKYTFRKIPAYKEQREKSNGIIFSKKKEGKLKRPDHYKRKGRCKRMSTH